MKRALLMLAPVGGMLVGTAYDSGAAYGANHPPANQLYGQYGATNLSPKAVQRP